MKDVGGKVRTALENTRGLQRLLKYINKSKNTQIPAILEEISVLECAHLLLEFLPLLEQIYRLESEEGLKWMDQYSHLLNPEMTELKHQEQLLSFARIKQVIEGKIFHGREPIRSPTDFVEENLHNSLYDLSPSQIVGIFLVVELMHRRVPYLIRLCSEHENDPHSLFSHVKDIQFKEKKAVQKVTQK